MPLSAAELFDPKEPVQDGLNVFQVSDVFADIFKKLDSVKWAGQNISVAIEGIEKIHPSAHIAATDDRVVLVWKDTIVGNWPRPDANDWRGFGQVTTALVLKMRSVIPSLRDMSDSGLYYTVVSALMKGIDENGKYIYSKSAEVSEDGRILTSTGIEAARDERGNFRVKGIIHGSPADAEGIREDDIITDINGNDISKMTDGDVASELSGFTSGTVKLTALNETGARRVTLRRATIVLADADIVNRAPYLEIIMHNVTDRAVAIVNEALAKHSDATGIILDLRASNGDDERAVAKIAGLFIGKKPVLRVIETAMDESEIVPGGDAVLSRDVPIVVLVSGGTRGTAEALAAAFYEHNRAVLVGTPTSGLGRLATRLDLDNGGQLLVLNRVTKTGLGRPLDGRGVFPLICLSNIRNTQQQQATFLNIINGDFNYQDFNQELDVKPEDIRKGCPAVTSGEDEDAMASAVSMQILSDQKIYKRLINNPR
ncbi:hypothetical protein FACS189421_09370 [Bacteroidia bacterium]|nr:hypothetical protein FACS189421_09370 [Bacteroidia bacterium]